ncbi:MAG: hypothetical protein ACLQUZ_10785 [Rhizomicrobium sp.]
MTVLKPSLWRRIVNTWHHDRRRRGCAIDLTPDGFVFKLRWRETAMRWAEITRIDVGIRNCLTFDILHVVLFAGDTKVDIEELDDGFRQFENGLFEHWPQIRAGWDVMLKSAPHEAHYETLWRRDG